MEEIIKSKEEAITNLYRAIMHKTLSIKSMHNVYTKVVPETNIKLYYAFIEKAIIEDLIQNKLPEHIDILEKYYDQNKIKKEIQ